MKFIVTLLFLFSCGTEPPQKPVHREVPNDQDLEKKPEVIVMADNAEKSQPAQSSNHDSDQNQAEDPNSLEPINKVSDTDDSTSGEKSNENNSHPEKNTPKTQPQIPPHMPPNIPPHMPPPNDGTKGDQFMFNGRGSDGIYALEFHSIPASSEIIWIYWGYNSDVPFTEVKTNNRLSFVTDASWGFGEKLDIKCEVYNSDGEKIAVFQTILKSEPKTESESNDKNE